MSAYMVSSDTINRIVTYLSKEFRDDSFTRRNFLEKSGIDFSGDWKNELVNKMYKLNTLGVYNRYDNRHPDMFTDEDNYKYEVKLYNNKYEVLKSLHCFLYQCNEGDNDKISLYNALKDIENHIAYDLVTSTKEYDMAQWG